METILFFFFLNIIAIGVVVLVADITEKKTEKKCKRNHKREVMWYQGKIRSLESENAVLKKSIKYYEDELIGDLNDEKI